MISYQDLLVNIKTGAGLNTQPFSFLYAKLIFIKKFDIIYIENERKVISRG